MEQIAEILQIAVLRIRIVFEELLQHFDLVVGEAGAIGPLAAGRRRIGRIRICIEALIEYFIELKFFRRTHAASAGVVAN